MSKETSAWMPLYVSDYLKGTMHLSTMEHGAYLLLIMHAWTHDGALPANEVRLARIAGMTPKEWKASREVILEFFEVHEGGIRHARIDREIEKAEAVVEQRRSAGRASAAARKAQRDGNDRSTPVATKAQRNGRPSNEGLSPRHRHQAAVDRLDRVWGSVDADRSASKPSTAQVWAKARAANQGRERESAADKAGRAWAKVDADRALSERGAG